MIIFLLIFLCLYGGINLYAFFKANNFFHFSGKTEIVIIILLIALILGPLIIRLAEKFHWETLARTMAYCGYLWMAFVFLFFFISITFDAARFLLKLFYQNTGNTNLQNIFFLSAIFLALVFVVYGFFDAQKIRINKIEINTEKIRPNHDKIRIVQISDVHIGLIIRGKRLQAILDKVKEANPDILVSTGDLLDGELNNVMPEARQLAEIKPRYGKYAVTGNHEFYAGLEKALEFTKSAGFEILRDESKKVAGINIIGLDDPTGRRSSVSKQRVNFAVLIASFFGRKSGVSRQIVDVSNLFPDEKSNDFVLLLKHQPTIREDKNFNLQLSGHTHGGQIFPFMFFTRLFFPETSGYHKLSDNKSVYISKGAGTWGPPVRFLASPEITIIDLTAK